jgi:hypothetical protein
MSSLERAGALGAQLAGDGEDGGRTAAPTTTALAGRGAGAVDQAGPGHKNDAGQAA